MLKLDNNLLDELGLGSLPEDQKRSMLQHIYETLELRVGTNLANQMTDQQLEEFEKFIDEGGDANQAEALKWLETNLPNYKEVVNQVFEALKLEIKQMAPQLVTASQQQPAMPQQAAPAPAPAAQMYQDQPQYGAPSHPTYAQPAQPQQWQTPTPAPQPSVPAHQQPYAQPQPPAQTDFQQPQAAPAQPQTDYQQPQQAPASSQPQGQGGFQPMPQGFQPAPQGFQPPQAPAQSQQPYPPLADTQQSPDQQAA